MNPTRVAVAGCGSIAVSAHLPACRSAADAGLCELVGVCDIVPERAEPVSREYGAPSFSTVAEMLAAARPEVLIITTGFRTPTENSPFKASPRDVMSSVRNPWP